MRFVAPFGRARALLLTLGLAAAPLLLGCASTGGAGTGPEGGGRSAQGDSASAREASLHPSGPGPARGAAVDPDRARAHYRLGADQLRRGRPAQALRELLRAEHFDPTDPWVQLALAEAYIHRGHLQDAEGHLQRALEIDPQFQEAKLHLSALFIHLERYAEAVPLARGLAQDPTYPQTWKALTNLGYAQFKLGEISDARRNLELATEYESRYWQAWLNLGILEEAEGRKLEALERFEKILTLRPGAGAAAEVHYRMALVYISLGNRDRALEHLTVASEQSGTPWGKRSVEYLERLR